MWGVNEPERTSGFPLRVKSILPIAPLLTPYDRYDTTGSPAPPPAQRPFSLQSGKVRGFISFRMTSWKIPGVNTGFKIFFFKQGNY